MKIQELTRHHNGISGMPFYAIRFESEANGQQQHLLGIVFEGAGHVAVINLDLIATHGVKGGENSWRGDSYEHGLREAIARAEMEQHPCVVCIASHQVDEDDHGYHRYVNPNDLAYVLLREEREDGVHYQVGVPSNLAVGWYDESDFRSKFKHV